jgi:PBSX family phage terminase large subunit
LVSQTKPKNKVIVFPYQPQPRQKLFHYTTTDPKYWADEILYGGAAGGGKSAAIVGDAFKNAVKYEGINILVLRRTLGELEGSIILKMLEWYPREICKYNSSKHVWEINIPGRATSRIWCGYCEQENDVYRYQGKEFEIIYIDEATHFTYTQFKYLKSRNRTANQKAIADGLRPHMKLTTNPGGVGHVWVKKRFIDIGEWEQAHNIQELDDEEQPVTDRNGQPVMTRRIFIPAKLSDNQYIDNDYENKLLTMEEKLRRQLLDGDWDALEGQFFSEFSRAVHVIEPFDIPSEWKRFRMMDEGYNDPYVCLWAALDHVGNCYIYREFIKSRLLSSEQAAKTNELTYGEKIDYSVGDTSFWNKGKTDGEAPYEVFIKHGIAMIQATKERVNGWKRVREWLHVFDDTDPVTGETFKNARLKIFKNCKGLIESIPAMIIDDTNPEDIEDHTLDHAPDALRYGLMSRPSPNKKKVLDMDTSMEARARRNIKSIGKKKKGMTAV